MFEFDEKGKIFTNVVTKIAVPCIVYTPTQKIICQVHVRRDERIKDELNRDERFLAVTEAAIYDLEGRLLYETDFVALNKAHVLWVLPQQDMKKAGDEA